MTRTLPLACLAMLLFAFPAPAQKLKTAPPGTIFLKDNIFIDRLPVTNNAYKEFLFAVQKFWSEKTHEAIPQLPQYGLQFVDDPAVRIVNKYDADMVDSIFLTPDMAFYERMKIPDNLVVDLATNLTMEYYSKAVLYKNNPVIYVSHEQAAMFCKWRSDMVMLHYALKSGGKGERKRYYSKVNYRLMTEDEWRFAYNTFGNVLLSDFGIRADFNKKSFAGYAPVDSKKAESSFSIYANNFAEMLLDRKAIIGALWNENSQSTQNIITSKYAPASNVGFRCVCEVEP